MRNSASFWDKTARPGDLVWCNTRSTRYDLGLVINIIGYDYWNFTETFSSWRYEIWVNGKVSFFPSWKIEKV